MTSGVLRRVVERGENQLIVEDWVLIDHNACQKCPLQEVTSLIRSGLMRRAFVAFHIDLSYYKVCGKDRALHLICTTSCLL